MVREISQCECKWQNKHTIRPLADHTKRLTGGQEQSLAAITCRWFKPDGLTWLKLLPCRFESKFWHLEASVLIRLYGCISLVYVFVCCFVFHNLMVLLKNLFHKLPFSYAFYITIIRDNFNDIFYLTTRSTSALKLRYRKEQPFGIWAKNADLQLSTAEEQAMARSCSASENNL